jgi:hypothetical protein
MQSALQGRVFHCWQAERGISEGSHSRNTEFEKHVQEQDGDACKLQEYGAMYSRGSLHVDSTYAAAQKQTGRVPGG